MSLKTVSILLFFIFSKNKVEGCDIGVGKNGYYEFSTSSVDYDPEMLWEYAPFFLFLM
jgi:hypothetical protein